MTSGARTEAALGGTFSADPSVRYAFSARNDGNLSHTVGGGDVAIARRRLAERVGAAPHDSVYMEQVHGGQVAVVGESERGRGLHSREDAVPGVDALVTACSGIALHVLVADCVPVLLAQPGGAVAAVHAGREGVRSGVVTAAVHAAAAGTPETVQALIGPAIGGCCYEVPAAMRDELAEALPEAWAQTREGQPSLDLVAAVRAQLGHAGVDTVEQVGGCTRCDSEHWFSHRASPDGPASGRQAGVIHRLPDRPHLPGMDDPAP